MWNCGKHENWLIRCIQVVESNRQQNIIRSNKISFEDAYQIIDIHVLAFRACTIISSIFARKMPGPGYNYFIQIPNPKKHRKNKHKI